MRYHVLLSSLLPHHSPQINPLGMRKMLLGWIVAGMLVGIPTWVAAETVAPSSPRSTPPTTPNPATQAREEQLRREASLELMRWLSTLNPGKTQTSGLHSAMQWIRTWIASRWGVRLSQPAWERWVQLTRYLGTWQPAPLYREIRFKQIHPRLFADLQGMQYHMTAPSPTTPWQPRLGSGELQFSLHPLKRKNSKDRRPYRLVLQTRASVMPLRAKELDTALLYLLQRFTDPKLHIPLSDAQKAFLQHMPSGHSRRIARWLNSRVPHTAALLRRYLKILNILEPIGKGMYRMDVRARWKLKPFQKDYPRQAKALTRQDTDFSLRTEFFDSKQRRWFIWGYESKTMEMRYQAVINREGLWMCNDQWQPVAGPWRLTQMGATWTTRTHIQYRSSNLKFYVRDFTLLWKVRETPTGAILSAEMVRNPAVDIQGGELLRILARILVSGGIRGLLERFLKNLATGDGGRGLRWNWELREGSPLAHVDLRIIVPIVPDSTLTALLRLGPSLARRNGNPPRQPLQPRRRRRSALPPLWHRIFTAIYKDLNTAYTTIAQRKP